MVNNIIFNRISLNTFCENNKLVFQNHFIFYFFTRPILFNYLHTQFSVKAIFQYKSNKAP